MSFEHSKKILNEYFESIGEVFSKIGDFERDIDSVDNYLKTDVCHSGFKRLN